MNLREVMQGGMDRAWGAYQALRGAPVLAGTDYDYGTGLEPSLVSSYNVLQYGASGGDTSLYQFAANSGGIGGYSRHRVIQYAVLQRCVMLVAGVIAEAITGGHLRIQDADRKTVKGARSEAVLGVLSYSLDGGDTPAYTALLDLGVDYCLSGNALMVPHFDYQGLLTGVTRCLVWGSDSYRDGVYRVTPADRIDGTVLQVSASDMMHARWARLLQYGRDGVGRNRFAIPPVITLRPAIAAGLQADRTVLKWFASGAQSKIVVSYPDTVRAKEPTPAQREETAKFIREKFRTGDPVVLNRGGTAQRVDGSPSDPHFQSLREHQLREASMLYGVPQLMLGEPTQNWSGHIEAISRLGYRWGMFYHLRPFLAALGTRLLPRRERFVLNPTWMIQGDYSALANFLQVLQGDAQREQLASRGEMRDVAGLPWEVDGEIPPKQSFREEITTRTEGGSPPPGD